MYLYITSEQSSRYFTDNTNTRFRVRLPKKLDLTPKGQWCIALLDIDMPRFEEDYKTSYLTVNSNICEPSYVNTSLIPTLNRIYSVEMSRGRPVYFDNPRYVKITSDFLDVIDIYLTDSKGDSPSFKDGDVICTLHLEKA